ncbi:MAG: hypothetical protein KJO01_12980 [Gammaproteobacteria bacterium]|nr:hypothetical protein [Gammaproteobacteria bacterium]MBT8111065.1 hypothetical protein [Gammaproteobacteria bacterium]NND47982.1 hypothetical protein [Woeseiaceae bacterium]
MTTYPPAVTAVMLSACATEPVLLNSERIEKRFGSYGIAVLASEAGLRRSSLYSLEDLTPTCRTYAVVRFADQLDDRYREEHAKVLAGNSIGAIFRSQGWDVHKQTVYIGSLALPEDDTAIGELMCLDGAKNLALHVYQLLLVRDDEVFEYATIVETHHPDYLAEDDLHELYQYDITTALTPHVVSELVTLVLGIHE